jgi:hypothetical protein
MLDRAKEFLQLQKKAREIQKALREEIIEVEKAGGKIKVVISGEQKIQEIKIDPSLLAADNVLELERNLKEAFSEAITRSQQVAASKMREMGGGLGIPGL